jgi:hypothetical protein
VRYSLLANRRSSANRTLPTIGLFRHVTKERIW